MSTISNSVRPDEGPPSAPPIIVPAPTVIPSPSPARPESDGVGPDRKALGDASIEAARDAPYNNTRSHKHINESPAHTPALAPTSVKSIRAALEKVARETRSCAPSPSPALKRENSLLCTVFDEDPTTFLCINRT